MYSRTGNCIKRFRMEQRRGIVRMENGAAEGCDVEEVECKS
jgi:hypothetical protein